MKIKERILIPIVARDFSLWLWELLRLGAVQEIPRVWGKGFSDQLVHYNGRNGEWYRYADEMETIGNFVAHKKLNDKIFSETTHSQFRKLMDHFRSLYELNPRMIKNSLSHFRDIKETLLKFYPYYHLSFMTPGAWREKFIAAHGHAGDRVLARLMQSREHSEGTVKECDIFLRAWIGSLLKIRRFSPETFKVLTVREIERFLQKGLLPSRRILDCRFNGYVLHEGKVIGAQSFNAFMKNHRLTIASVMAESAIQEVTGMVACQGGKIRGRVSTIFNTEEVPRFKPQSILVTNMTSPEYLPAIKQAKAIVTDEGGLTCHAAIVSRELGIPCIIGTKIATQVFKDGDRVEVDATRGIVRKL